MPEKDPLPVEITEPVEVESRTFLNGYRWISIGYLLLAAGIAAGLFLGFSNDRKLEREVQARCQVSEESRLVLRNEHTRKLARAKAKLRHTQAFIASGRHIQGLTDADLKRALEDAKLDVGDEQELLRHVQPRPCK